MRAAKAVVITVIALVLASIAVCYAFLKSEGLSARRKPSNFEYAVANYALRLSIPTAAKNGKNPITPTPEALTAARKDYSDYCAVCHANDGAGNTDTAKGLSPEVPDLRARHVQELKDGQIFYVVKNGIRFTGMPGWNFQDERIWRLVSLIRQFAGGKTASSTAVRQNE